MHVTITAETVRNAVIVPPAALLPSTEGGTSVITVGPDMIAHEHKVQVGIRAADKAPPSDNSYAIFESSHLLPPHPEPLPQDALLLN